MNFADGLKEIIVSLKETLQQMNRATRPPQLEEMRCMKCNKLLGKFRGLAEVKCTRCKTFNSFKN